jgi:hypothetical protein
MEITLYQTLFAEDKGFENNMDSFAPNGGGVRRLDDAFISQGGVKPPHSKGFAVNNVLIA